MCFVPLRTTWSCDTSPFAPATSKTHSQRPKSNFPLPLAAPAQNLWSWHKPEADFAGVMQAVLLDVSLEVGRAADGPALRAAVRGLVSVDPLVGAVAALVGQHHLAHLASLMEERLIFIYLFSICFPLPPVHPRNLSDLGEAPAHSPAYLAGECTHTPCDLFPFFLLQKNPTNFQLLALKTYTATALVSALGHLRRKALSSACPHPAPKSPRAQTNSPYAGSEFLPLNTAQCCCAFPTKTTSVSPAKFLLTGPTLNF